VSKKQRIAELEAELDLLHHTFAHHLAGQKQTIERLKRENESLDIIANRAETALSICAEWVARDSINAVMQVTADAVADLAYKEAVAREEEFADE